MPWFHRETRRIVAPALCTWVIASCGGDSTPATVTVRDSLGVSIVQHSELAVHALELEPTPGVTIGVTDGQESYQFFGVTDALRRNDGSIVVLDRSRTIRAYDSAGVHLWTAGRPGPGPGEFAVTQHVSELAGDTLAVWDPGPGRLSLFTGAGQLARTWTPPDMAGSAVVVGIADDERLLVDQRRLERGLVDGHSAVTVHSDLQLLDVRNGIVLPLGRRLMAIQFQEVDDNGAYSHAIFGTSAVYAPAPAGFWFGDAKSGELQRATTDGVGTILRWSGPGEVVRDEDVAALLEKWSSAPDITPQQRQFLVEYGRTHPRAERFPSYEEIRTDPSGNLWVRDYVREHEDDGIRRWWVFSPDGQDVVGRLQHPATLEPLRMGVDGVLGVERDELGIERIVYRRLIR